MVIASPWPRTGTANIYEAQTSFLANAGFRVALLVSPCDYWHNAYNQQLVADVEEGFNWASIDLVSWASFGSDLIRAKLLGRLRWIAAGRDSQLKIQARMSLQTSFAKEFKEFLLTHRIEVIYANHVFQAKQAEKVARFLTSNLRPRPQIILETHDIQALLNTKALRKNAFSKVPDFQYRLLEDELLLMSTADKITHLSLTDMEFFSKRLPSKEHFLIPPTLSPTNEKKLITARTSASQRVIDFLWVGNNNPGNIISLRWFLEFAMPHLPEDLNIYFVGTVREYFAQNEPALFKKYRGLFLGEVPDVTPYYESAKAVLVPITFGTGVSIKFVEALCMGKPVVASPLAFRGFPQELIDKLPVKGEVTPIGFAKAMMTVHQAEKIADERCSAFYDSHLSNKRFCELLSKATALSTVEQFAHRI